MASKISSAALSLALCCQLPVVRCQTPSTLGTIVDGKLTVGLLDRSPQIIERSDIAKLPHIKAASASMRIFQPQFGSGTEDVRRGQYRAKSVILQGNQPSIGEIFDLKIQSDRFFN